MRHAQLHRVRCLRWRGEEGRGRGEVTDRGRQRVGEHSCVVATWSGPATSTDGLAPPIVALIPHHGHVHHFCGVSRGPQGGRSSLEATAYSINAKPTRDVTNGSTSRERAHAGLHSKSGLWALPIHLHPNKLTSPQGLSRRGSRGSAHACPSPEAAAPTCRVFCSLKPTSYKIKPPQQAQADRRRVPNPPEEALVSD
ncbi:hypothetical protein SKAU_G00027840 [Synaphobranchus kaupii]|uniref:Uncharacterized protein n=1 Tax=Synaphobranchus kaupii TaxID=118154 RepID=A0A9Q1GD21_SYNKA|nr:hypothetical protein SKAU_G00027840 [Synaphobranchus kaupii]